jgi:hypothetical protein
MEMKINCSKELNVQPELACELPCFLCSIYWKLDFSDWDNTIPIWDDCLPVWEDIILNWDN